MFQTTNNYDSKNLLTIYHSAGRIWEAVKIPMMELTSDVVGNLPPIYLRRNQRHQVKPHCFTWLNMSHQTITWRNHIQVLS